MTDLTRIYGRGVPFTVAKQYAPRFQALLDDPEWGDYAFDASQSGGYNPRNIAGTNTPSQHSFGRAIDINWTRNARGTPGDIDPELAKRLAARHGFIWGGAWKNPDAMHWEIDPNWQGQTAAAPPLAERALTTYAGLGGPQPEPQSTPMANGNGILSKPIDPQEELMGILGNMQNDTVSQLMIAAGAGLASGRGWGAGTAAALQGMGDVLSNARTNRMKLLGLASDMQAQQQRLALEQQKANQPPSTELIRNYHVALTQGFKGSLIDFQKAMRAGDGSRVPMGFQTDPNDPNRLSFVPGGPYDPAVIAEQSQARGRGRQFSVNDIAKLTDEGTEFANVRNFATGFQDSFGGYTPGFGDINMAAGRMGFGNENASKAAMWWQDYDRYKNKIRNNQFGATLTPSEQAEWLKADIHPTMSPKIIRNNLAIQQRIIEGAIKRKASALIQGKYDPDVISEAYGINLGELGIDANVRNGTAPPGSSTGVPAIGTVEDGYRFKGGNPAHPNSWEPVR